ncbi:kynurenine formamidase [Neobacillus niacini]|uniref:cyclase family protein n=1 Tax=Neobacillus niacini TaxID=86668 RepID=UPI002863D715|nr:cyclase family protein [Neobacillus niacini]MDR7076056.1 kynurenine formamidase [Neobacillus niacini]
MSLRIPKFNELPTIGESNEHHAWEVFGKEDHLGTMNFITNEKVVSACTMVRNGKVICLSLPLNVPSPSLVKSRDDFRHEVHVSRSGRDDLLDNFYLQSSSQWDSLRHIRYREFGYYGGREESDLDTSNDLGIDFIAKNGIITRGVLVDLEAYFATTNYPVDPRERRAFTTQDIDRVLEWQGVTVLPGDILLFRTGWLKWYLSIPTEQRIELKGSMHPGEGGLDVPGIEAGKETARWLWDHKVAAVAADNPSFEVLRVNKERGFLHRLLIPLLGMPIGEFWFLEDLSEFCSSSKQYEFLLVSAPLNLPKGVGSPNNAYAIF